MVIAALFMVQSINNQINNIKIYIYKRRRLIGISGSLIWSKTLIFNPVVNFGEVWRAQLAKSTLLASALVPLDSFKYFKVY